MSFEILRNRTRRWVLLPAVIGLALGAAGCSDDNSGGNGPGTPRAFNQVQRLANPLLSEVILAKRSHAVHGSIGPAQDVAQIGPEIISFITTVAGRSQAYANTLGSVLLPDMLIVQTDKDPATAGWLTWVNLAPFSNGYGGRKLEDDVLDLATLALFGDPFNADPTVTPSLISDNIPNDSQFLTAFPYVGIPN